MIVRYGLRDRLRRLFGEPVLVVLLGFDAMHRYLNHFNFAFVWTALHHWSDLRDGVDEEVRP